MVYFASKYCQLTRNNIKYLNSLTLLTKLATATATAVKSPNIEYTQLFINNNFVDAKNKKTFETINPTNGKVIAKVASCRSR
jgi:hypothetical protein